MSALSMLILILNTEINKEKNIHRIALSAIRGELLERETERERKSFGISYTC